MKHKVLLGAVVAAMSLSAFGCGSKRTAATIPASPRTDGAEAAQGGPLYRENVERLQDAMAAFQELMAAPDSAIPQDLLNGAHCVVVVPALKKAALGIGAKYGKGYFSCRQNGTNWTAPASVIVEGGSVGFQIGAESTDVVMLVMNKAGEDHLLSTQFTLGGQASVAAGPVGRSAEARTDASMGAEILTWARSRGVFAGVSLSGATVREDMDDNEALYGRRLSNRDIIEGGLQPPNQAAQQFVSMLAKAAGRSSS